jgi:hypothetical protein
VQQFYAGFRESDAAAFVECAEGLLEGFLAHGEMGAAAGY